MLEWFQCPDKQLIPVKDCFTKCRLLIDCSLCGSDGRSKPTLAEPNGVEVGCIRCGSAGKVQNRCEPLPYLHLAAAEREWTGTPSTTQLLNGTMMSFLKITKPYAIDPDGMAFAIHGTLAHTQLEEKARELGMVAEVSATLDGRNVADLIEKDNGDVILTDYKTWGSFRVAKALGIVEAGKKPDPSGEVYKSSGKWGKAGSPKMVSVFQQVSSESDNYEAELQLNRYRIMLAKLEINITRMRVHAIVRDGGLAVAKSRGVDRNTYLIPIKEWDNNIVEAYFEKKETDLKAALKLGDWHESCDNRECWDGVRCREYCEVAIYCPKGIIEKGGK